MFNKSFMKFTGLLLIAAMLTGCGSKSNNNSTPTDAAAKNESTEAKGDGKTEEIKVMIWDRGTAAPGTTNEENALTKWIQEQVLAECNVKVTYMAVPRSGSDDKLNVMMAGGNAPDIVFTYDQSIFGNYASNGGLADLTEALASNGGTINETIGNIQYMGQLDGKQYAIMKRRGLQVPRHVGYIRKDWLDALGMKVPTNKEELFQALKAFKEKNPGNVSKVIPWAMGGTSDTEMFYLNFIGSYVPALSEEDAYVYSENFKIFADGAVNGIRQMNALYNEGLITPDFATDTSNDIFVQDVTAGNAGFILVDSTNPFGWIPVLKSNVENAELVPLNCFDTPEGNYLNPTEPLYGMYIMVPETSSAKAGACVKYLNWLADPVNAENVAYSPDHTRDEAGVPLYLKEEELNEAGYPGNLGDYNIVNDHLEYVNNKEGVVAAWSTGSDWATTDWYNNLYDVMNTDMYLYPTYPVVLESEATYISNLKTMSIEYVYKLISCPASEFDSLQVSEYDRLVKAGLEKVFDDRRTYYQENVAGK